VFLARRAPPHGFSPPPCPPHCCPGFLSDPRRHFLLWSFFSPHFIEDHHFFSGEFEAALRRGPASRESLEDFFFFFLAPLGFPIPIDGDKKGRPLGEKTGLYPFPLHPSPPFLVTNPLLGLTVKNLGSRMTILHGLGRPRSFCRVFYRALFVTVIFAPPAGRSRCPPLFRASGPCVV